MCSLLCNVQHLVCHWFVLYPVSVSIIITEMTKWPLDKVIWLPALSCSSRIVVSV